LWCGKRYETDEKRDEVPPRCECKRILKPDVIFFGEAIPQDAMNRSFQLASSAQALMVIGTSAVVSPVNTIPSIAKQNGAKIIEINIEPTVLTTHIADIFLKGKASEVVTGLVDAVERVMS